MYQSKHNSILLPINIVIGLHVSPPTASSSGPQDTDPEDDSVGVETCSPIPMLIGNKILLCLY